MHYCDLTLPTPEENLACDEALLDLCEEGHGQELLRLWQPAQYFVVLGYANNIATEANLAFCRQNKIPVLRRWTGGGAVLQGPGVLNYALILRADSSGQCHTITAANNFILKRQQAALSDLLQKRVEKQGHTDLAISGLKFCGHGQRRKKQFLLFHGSFLLSLDLSLIEKALRMPSRQPDYRHGRSHSEFLMNLEIPAEKLKAALLRAWNATAPLAKIPSDRIRALIQQKYSQHEWNFKF